MKRNGHEAAATLEQQRAALAAELAKLERQAVDAVRDLDGATQRAARMMTLRAALDIVDADLTAARELADAEAAGQAETARLVAYDVATARAAAALQVIADELPRWGAVADEAAAAVAAVARLGYTDAVVSGAVYRLAAALRQCEQSLRTCATGRALLKLPAEPTAEERLLSGARADVARMEELLRAAKEIEATPELSAARRRQISDTLVALQGARARLAALEGRAYEQKYGDAFAQWLAREADGGSWFASSRADIEQRERDEATERLLGGPVRRR